MVMAEERRVRKCLVKAQSKEGAEGGGRGEVSALEFWFRFFFFWSFTLVVRRERTSSHCGGLALKVVPMAHAATLTQVCTLAAPRGPVT